MFLVVNVCKQLYAKNLLKVQSNHLFIILKNI